MSQEYTVENSPAGEHERRVQEIRVRRLEIAAELAEMKRAYVVEGADNCFARRVTLEAESAKITLELSQIKDIANKEKVARKVALDKSFLRQLTQILGDKGMSDIIAEAKAKAEAA